MCRVTHSDNSLSPSLCRKRSSFSNSSRSSSSSSMQKRVSFDETIHIHSFQRLQYEELREMFYCPNDYRRFRSDTCLELLDQQFPPPQNPLVNMGKKFLGGWKREERKETKSKKNGVGMNPADYPWMTPYHPHEDSAAVAANRRRKTIDAVEARKMLEELAFLP